jgi:hypothetical protein
MSAEANPTAPHHLPIFITAPGQTDVLFNVMAIFLVVMVLLVVIFYFTLHSLPERIAHKGQKIQFEIVAILALISLFTHNHFFWIAGLLLAFMPIPDFSTPLEGMAESLARMAGRRKAPPSAQAGPSTPAYPAEPIAPAAVGAAAANAARPIAAASEHSAPVESAEQTSGQAAAADESGRRLRTVSKESA